MGILKRVPRLQERVWMDMEPSASLPGLHQILLRLALAAHAQD
jgi:hypothetical protein